MSDPKKKTGFGKNVTAKIQKKSGSAEKCSAPEKSTAPGEKMRGSGKNALDSGGKNLRIPKKINRSGKKRFFWNQTFFYGSLITLSDM